MNLRGLFVVVAMLSASALASPAASERATAASP